MFASKDVFFTNRSGGYAIARSVRLRSSASAYLNRTPASATNQKTWTWSGWVKRGVLGATQNTLFASTTGATDTTYFQMAFSTIIADCLLINSYNITSLGMQTAAVFRDPAAWYHIVFALDTTQATASNRMKLYVNGVQQTSFLTYINYPALNSTFAINSAAAHNIGASNATSPFDGYLTEVNFIDGQALTPSSFGSTNTTTGVWQPIKYTGTYGTNGFYLNFGNNASTTTLGYDTSGNSNNWTTNNISLTAGSTYDSMTDVPTLTSATAANYCVFNPVNVSGGGTTTITDGNLATSVGSTTTYGKVLGSIGMSTGKWYWEVTVTAVGSLGLIGIGDGTPPSATYGLGGVAGELAYFSNGNKYTNAVSTSYGATYTTNDLIGVAYDADAGSITFYKNNTSQGAITGFSGTKYAAVGSGGGTNPQYAINFGQRPFSYTPPTGFVALNTYNLPTPTISNGANYMAASTYTANASTQTIVNSGNNPAGISFQPDLVWTKSRTGAYSHELFDVNRGVNAYIGSNNTNAEVVGTAQLTSFNSNGFTLGANENSNYTNGYAAVAWQWKASGSTVSNTNGSITSTVSVNATAGFSVVTFTGVPTSAGTSTVGHGLGVAPKFIILKNRDLADNWYCYNANIGNGNYISLNTTGASTAGALWANTTPTSTVFSITNGSFNSTTAQKLVSYCFAEVAGYSKFGSYTGNGSTDGPFVFTGFRPRFLMVKRTDTTSDWTIVDTSRNPSNLTTQELYADLSNAEGASTNFDLLSNGFKLRGFAGYVGASGGTYIYACFAENPLKYALAR